MPATFFSATMLLLFLMPFFNILVTDYIPMEVRAFLPHYLHIWCVAGCAALPCGPLPRRTDAAAGRLPNRFPTCLPRHAASTLDPGTFFCLRICHKYLPATRFIDTWRWNGGLDRRTRRRAGTRRHDGGIL